MNWRDPHVIRKAVYVGLIVALLFPLAWLSAPSTRNENGDLSPGGQLSQIRAKHGIMQASLGEVDPASETMKLSLLGARPIATVLLWQQANEQKKRHQWDELQATLNVIGKLQPNFPEIWKHQAWNISYNVSVEFDNYQHRYHWIKRGCKYMFEGLRLNRKRPRMLREMGNTFGQKFGRADEHVQFRELFREDDDFHQAIRDEGLAEDEISRGREVDNWLVAHAWHVRAEQLVDELAMKMPSPAVFFSSSGLDLMKYAEALAEEQKWDRVETAWSEAWKAWQAFGEREIRTSFGTRIHLVDLDGRTIPRDVQGLDEAPSAVRDILAEVEQLENELDRLAPGVRETLEAQGRESLTASEKAALDKAYSERTAEEQALAESASEKIRVTELEVANSAPPRQRDEALQTAYRLLQARTLADHVKSYRSVVNYEYWWTRAKVERRPEVAAARKKAAQAERVYFDESNFEKAKQLYEEVWTVWSDVYQEHPELIEAVDSEEMLEDIVRYKDVLDQLREPFPSDFPLRDLLDYHRDHEKVKGWYRSEAVSGPDPDGGPGEGPSDSAPPTPAPPEPRESALESIPLPPEPAEVE